MRSVRSILSASAMLLLGASPASAHPHIWIDATVALVAAPEGVSKIAIVWKFDSLFSGAVAADFDRDGDGRLSPAEADALAKVTLPSIAEYDYFTNLRIGGEPAKVAAPQGFRAELRDGLLYYGFAIPLGPPVDPRKTEIAFSLYDKSYYTDVSTEAEGAIRLMGDWPAGCSVEKTEDVGNPIYFGMVFPVLHVVKCR